MRIISGTRKGKKLIYPNITTTRPMTDRLKESLFNILDHRFHVDYSSAAVFDAFAGSGALGLEALSRGALFCLFVEKNADAFQTLEQNAALFTPVKLLHCGIEKAHVQYEPLPFDLVFLAPPYHKGLVPPTLDRLKTKGWLKKGSLVVIECASDETLAFPGDFIQEEKRTYTTAQLIFLRYNDDTEEE